MELAGIWPSPAPGMLPALPFAWAGQYPGLGETQRIQRAASHPLFHTERGGFGQCDKPRGLEQCLRSHPKAPQEVTHPSLVGEHLLG